MTNIIYDQNYFDKELHNYEIKPIKTIFENIGGLCFKNNIDCSKIKDEVKIEIFYNLSNELRAKVLKHVLGSNTNCSAWSLHMMSEAKNVPHHLRSSHSFPKTYKLVYSMGDKSNDIIVKEILTILKKELDFENNKKEVEKIKTLKSSKSSSNKSKSCSNSDSNEDKQTKKHVKSDSKTDLDENNISKSKSVKSVKSSKSDKKDLTEEKPEKKKKKTIPPSLKIKIWNKYIGDEIGKTKCLCCKI